MQHNAWIWRMVPIGLVITGTVGNLLNIAVLLRPRIWKISSTIFLLCLAVSDLFFLWTTIVPRIYEEINLVNLSDFNQQAFCRTQVWINHVFGGYSIGLLAALTVDRTILSRSAVLVRRRRNVYITCGIMFVICVLFPLHFFWGYQIQSKKAVIGKWALDHFTGTSGLLVVLNVVPMLIVILGNINIRINIVRQKRR
ncbi:hypothetical protein DPMN_152055 [Dreissena polymorpha]|uniref:G-protein coupled receptors family 1 profile domain-containing protein n=1 Tax=Dreissena polymorpha TaxID=45954 RepID=A0A9D4J3J2_DREPO|nr:hypothetical protein DPMN_152055 [Dreissena polymorpha]